MVCKSCLTRTLNKLETMMTILQGETTQGTMTPTGIADNILNITGGFCSRGSGWRLTTLLWAQSSLLALLDSSRLREALQAFTWTRGLARAFSRC